MLLLLCRLWLWVDTNALEAQQNGYNTDSADYPILIDLLAFMTQKYQQVIEREAPRRLERVQKIQTH
jgi:hypothetical protein